MMGLQQTLLGSPWLVFFFNAAAQYLNDLRLIYGAVLTRLSTPSPALRPHSLVALPSTHFNFMHRV
jgi:hypothetical protein